MWITWCILAQDVQEILYPKGHHVSFVSKGFSNSGLDWFRDLVSSDRKFFSDLVECSAAPSAGC